MAQRLMHVDGVGEVTFQKRRGARSIRLKVDLHGKPVVTLPYFVPYMTAARFVSKHEAWIAEESAKRTVPLEDGMSVGRAHTLRAVHDSACETPRTRVTASEVIVRHAADWQHMDTQAAARKACLRALKQEAAIFLPKRVTAIAAAHDYTFRDVVVKQMRGRWGSCSQDKRITLNIFLMQLPVPMIDYVILHELAHTRAMHHGPDFWKEMERVLPNARALRKEMKAYEPNIPALR